MYMYNMYILQIVFHCMLPFDIIISYLVYSQELITMEYYQ